MIGSREAGHRNGYGPGTVPMSDASRAGRWVMCCDGGGVGAGEGEVQRRGRAVELRAKACGGELGRSAGVVVYSV